MREKKKTKIQTETAMQLRSTAYDAFVIQLLFQFGYKHVASESFWVSLDMQACKATPKDPLNLKRSILSRVGSIRTILLNLTE